MRIIKTVALAAILSSFSLSAQAMTVIPFPGLVIPLPDLLRLDVFYLNGEENLNLGIPVNTLGDVFSFSSEQTPATLEPTPPLAGQATQLSNGGLEIVVAGGNVQAGLQNPFELNDLEFMERVELNVGWSQQLSSDVQLDFVGTSIDAGTTFSEVDQGFYRVRISGGSSSHDITAQLVAATFTGSSPPIDTGIKITFTVVPVPPAIWLFASGIGFLSWMRSRR